MVANTRVINGNLQDTELTESLLVVTIGVNEKKIKKKKILFTSGACSVLFKLYALNFDIGRSGNY